MARIVIELAETFLYAYCDTKSSNQHSFHPYTYPLPWQRQINILDKNATQIHQKLTVDISLVMKWHTINGSGIYISSWTETRNLNYICKTLDVINLLRSGWGFQCIEKRRFSSRSNDISSVYAVTGTQECTFLKYNKVSAINL